jgi:acyl-CoA synthetase (AMP-forming)/AMP-acid ligase II
MASETPAAATHSELIMRALRCFPERIAFRQGDRTVRYDEAEDLISRFVTVLRALGLRSGGGVGLLSPNRPEVWLTQAAPGFLGGSYTAMNPLGSFEDHLYACDEAELKILVVDPAYAERGAELLDHGTSVEQLLTLGPSSAGQDLLRLAAAAEPSALHKCTVSPESTTWLLYTGGTTGVPKAAELPERAVAQMAMSVSVGWDLPKRRNYLAVAPISHAAGMLVTPTLLAGGTVSLMKAWDPQEWLATAARDWITLSFLVPTMIYSLLDFGAIDTADLSTLETIMYGASPMAPSRLREGLECLGQVFCQLCRFPCCDSALALARCALADVASKTISMSSKQGRSIRPRTPPAVVATSCFLARAKPSEAGSMPTIAPISSDDDRSTFTMRSVPMFPEPITATLVALIFRLSRECRRDRTEGSELRTDSGTGSDRDHRPQRARQHHIARPKR